MASVNKVILVGNLGRDPETRYAPSGGAICNVTIATSRNWKDKATGEKREETEWHRVVFYDRLAEIAGEYLRKGRPVYVEGRLKTRKWQDKDGQDRYTTEIVGEYVKKGRPIYVEGRLKTRKWQDKDGVEKYTTEIIAEEMQLLGAREGGGGGGGFEGGGGGGGG